MLTRSTNQTDDIFLAQILGHKLLGPNASLSVGQSYKDFYVKKRMITEHPLIQVRLISSTAASVGSAAVWQHHDYWQG